MQVIEPPWSDADVDALRQRNAERVRVAIERLGPAWVLYKGPHAPIPIVCDERTIMACLSIVSRDLAALPMVRIDRAVNSVQHSRP